MEMSVDLRNGKIALHDMGIDAEQLKCVHFQNVFRQCDGGRLWRTLDHRTTYHEFSLCCWSLRHPG